MNLVEATIVEEDGGWFVRFGEHRLRIPDQRIGAEPQLRATGGRPLVLGMRPEHFEDAAIAGAVPDDQRITAPVELVEHLGAEAYVHMSLEAPTVLTDDTRELARDAAPDTTTGNGQGKVAGERTPGVARVDPRTRARKGGTVDLAVDTEHLYFFDLESGKTIDSQVGDVR
jgi:multiple sugar transport system ATP-binding protein